ncbi:hypothetical protein Q1695_012110 [Nippostrongylus brasiliensis]|nr:hypothetical protein Q1695_012110 [Nippostrongylus brasiliensis]
MRKLSLLESEQNVMKTVENRVDTIDKVDFIKECLFMFYEIHEMARRTTWTAVRNSLDSRDCYGCSNRLQRREMPRMRQPEGGVAAF